LIPAIKIGFYGLVLTLGLGASLPVLAADKPAAGSEKFRNPDAPLSERVANLLSLMTLDEKITQMSDRGEFAHGVKRLNIPPYKWWNEGVHGVLYWNCTVFPQAIGLASSWDPNLVHQVATAVSDEARALYNQGKIGLTFWSPVINIGRDPRWGRTQEAYGEDPYLAGRLGVAFVKGLQGDDPYYLKLVATPKHFAANNDEARRHTGSADMSERLLREYYLPHFRDCVVEGKAHSVMCAYNSINDVPCCANPFLLEDILRKEWGFDGYVVSDCWAVGDIYNNHHFTKTQEAAVAAALNAGCDLECGEFYDKFVSKAVKDGLVSEKTVDRSVTRLLEAKFRLGIFDPPERVPYSSISASVIDGPEHRALARQAARESIVLLKNKGGLLPLNRKKIRSIAVIGPNADVARIGDYTGGNANLVSPLEGLRKAAGPGVKIDFVRGCRISGAAPIPSEVFVPARGVEGEHGLKAEYFTNTSLSGKPALTRLDDHVEFDWKGPPAPGVDKENFSIRWTGKLVAPVTGPTKFVVTTDDGERLFLDGKRILNHWAGRAAASDSVTVQLKAGQAYDLKLEYYQGKGDASASLGWELPNTPKISPDIKIAKDADVAVVFVGTDDSVEGEEKDRADVSIPSSQMELIQQVAALNPNTVVVLINGSPLEVGWANANVPALVEAWFPGEEGGNAIAETLFGDANPGGRLPMTFYKSLDQLFSFNDYDITKGRTYMYLKDAPLFPFGYGLSYTVFKYGKLKIKPAAGEGGKITVSATVWNTGDRDGDEVVQLYVRCLHSAVLRPFQQLKGFKRVHIEKYGMKKVSFEIPVRDLAYYDTGKSAWTVEAGDYELRMGASSADIRQTGTITIPGR
jgi:beta-glucosidase